MKAMGNVNWDVNKDERDDADEHWHLKSDATIAVQKVLSSRNNLMKMMSWYGDVFFQWLCLDENMIVII